MITNLQIFQAADLSNLTKTFEFASFEQANHFVQRVGKFCSEKDHHPEWQTSADGKVVSAKLSSHFAGNMVTLYDFQLAEQMNKSYQISLKEYKPFPRVNSKTKASLKIFLFTYVLGVTFINIVTNWGHTDPPASKRGDFESLRRLPVVVPPFVIDANVIGDQKDLDAWVEKEASDYAYKTLLFKAKGLF